MATERQKAKSIKDGIKKGEKDLKKILEIRRKAVAGAYAYALNKKNFISSATERNRLYSELASQYRILNEDINNWMMRESEDIARKWHRFASEDLENPKTIPTFGKWSKQHLNDIVGAINPSTVNNLVAVNAHIGGMLDNDIRLVRAAVSTVLAEGAVNGLNNREMTTLMKERVNKSTAGKFQFIDKGGRKWNADTYFAMINRTVHAKVARDSYNSTASDAGFDLLIIEGGITAGSLKNPNDPCSRWAGKIVSQTGATPGYPTLQDAYDDGMFHPNCVHFTRALLPSEIAKAEEKQKEVAKDGAEARKEVNDERKADGLKTAKFAGIDGRISTNR